MLAYLFAKYRFYHWDRNAIDKFQLRQASIIAKHAFSHSAFFGKLYAGINLDFRSLEEIDRLPRINKKIVMENFTEYNTLGLVKEDVLAHCLEVEKTRDFSIRYRGMAIGMSSGTSGNKGIEVVTNKEEQHLAEVFFARFPFPEKQKLNLAFILRVFSPAFNKQVLGHKVTYVSQLDTKENILANLEKINPNAISAPASMLRILAKEKQNNNLKINPVLLVSYAEVLSPDVKEYIRRIFNCPVYQIYKCTEGAIAMSCRQGSLHINEDLVRLQPLDQEGKPVKTREPCTRLLVTDLIKKSVPIINYELNDIITLSDKKCSCGSRFRIIESIQGRADDIFYARRKDKKTMQFIFPDYISRAIISSSEDIEEYQAVQESPEKILVRIVSKQEADRKALTKNIADNIRHIFEKYDCIRPEIKISFEAVQYNPNSNKLIRIHRAFAIDDLIDTDKNAMAEKSKKGVNK